VLCLLHACSSEASVGPYDTSKDIDNGLDEKFKTSCASIEGCAGSPLIVDHQVVGLLTSGVHGVDVYRTVPTLQAVFRRWLLLEETVSVQTSDVVHACLYFILATNWKLVPLSWSGPTDCQ
jgi:hypothetical protein